MLLVLSLEHESDFHPIKFNMQIFRDKNSILKACVEYKMNILEYVSDAAVAFSAPRVSITLAKSHQARE